MEAAGSGRGGRRRGRRGAGEVRARGERGGGGQSGVEEGARPEGSGQGWTAGRRGEGRARPEGIGERVRPEGSGQGWTAAVELRRRGSRVRVVCVWVVCGSCACG